MQQGDPKVVRFGLFEMDLKAGELHQSGVRIKLQNVGWAPFSPLHQRL